MQKPICSVVVALGLVSLGSCFTAEFVKSNREDVRWNQDRDCYIPGSRAFGLGTAAVLCLVLAQIIGNIDMYRLHRTRHKTEDGYKAAGTSTLPRALLFLSWASFAVVILLLSTAVSMSRTQAYGKGWLDEECYLVKDGIFAASGCLVLLTIGALTVAGGETKEKKQVEQIGKTQVTIKTQAQETREHDQETKTKSETTVFLVEEANVTTDRSRI